jgi:hypothetical protein
MPVPVWIIELGPLLDEPMAPAIASGPFATKAIQQRKSMVRSMPDRRMGCLPNFLSRFDAIENYLTMTADTPAVPLRMWAHKRGAKTGRGAYRLRRIERASSAVADGVLPTFTPAASSASFLAAAVPDDPDTIAPAWPIVLPSGAVKPAT